MKGSGLDASREKKTITFPSVSGNAVQSCVFPLSSSLSITLRGSTVVGTYKTAIGPQGRAKSEWETLTDGSGPLHFTDM